MGTVLNLREDQLLQIVRALGLEGEIQRVYATTAKNPDGSPRDKTGAKQYLEVLQRHHLASTYGESVPVVLQQALRFAPQLPVEAKATQLPYLLRDDRVVEAVWGSYRVMVGWDGEHFGAYSRFISSVDFMPLNHREQLDMTDAGVPTIPFFADCEIRIRGAQERALQLGLYAKDAQEATSQLLIYGVERSFDFELLVLDVLMLRDKEVWNWPLRERLKARARLVEGLHGCGIDAVEPEMADSGAERAFYEGVVRAGGWGVFARLLAAPYAPGRRVKDWMRLKATLLPVTERTALCYVAFAMPSDEVMFEIRRASAFTGDVAYYGACRLSHVEGARKDRVAEVAYECWDYDSECVLTSPRFVRWRDDVSPDRCVFEAEACGGSVPCLTTVS